MLSSDRKELERKYRTLALNAHIEHLHRTLELYAYIEHPIKHSHRTFTLKSNFGNTKLHFIDCPPSDTLPRAPMYQRSAILGIGIEVLTLGPVLVLVLGIDLGLLAVLVLVLGIVLSLLEVLVLVLGIDHGLLRVLILLLSFVKNFYIYQG